MGAAGSIDAPLALAPWHYAELFSAWEAGDMARAQSLQNGVRRYVDLVWMFGAPAHVCKAVMSARLGVDCGRPIPPVNRLSDDERREVLRVAESLGLIEPRAQRSPAGRTCSSSA
jgi:dihydrodipicolinate synthase/N-acetylneuraminate lyase